MARKLTRRSQQRLKRMIDGVDSISKMANKINLAELEELVRRDEIQVTPENFAGGGGFAVGRRGGKPSGSSVERAVIARLEGRKIYDPLKEQVRDIERMLIDAEENLRRVHESMKAIREGVEKTKGRKPVSAPCEICNVLPAAKTAMCIGCYKEWIDSGAPDRSRWKAYKQQSLGPDGRVLIETPPPARHPLPNS